MKKDKRKRTNVMNVYLSDEEYKIITDSSNRAGLSISTFARNVCLGLRVESKENNQIVLDLIKINADLGRLGGLLKLAIAETGDIANFRPLLRDFERLKDDLRWKIRQL